MRDRLPKVKLPRKPQVDTLVNATNDSAYFLCIATRAHQNGIPAQNKGMPIRMP